MDQKDKVSKVFMISLLSVSGGFGNDFKFLKHVRSKTSQFEIIVKLLACFNTKFQVKRSF